MHIGNDVDKNLTMTHNKVIASFSDSGFVHVGGDVHDVTGPAEYGYGRRDVTSDDPVT